MSDIITATSWEQMASTGALPEGVALIKEDHPFEILQAKTVITENQAGTKVKRMRLTGIFQKADAFNENRRRYSYDVINDAVSSIQEAVQSRKVMGELDHPADAKIHLDRVSHLITKIWMEGKNVLGELEILEDMPCGKILKTLVESDVMVGISSRGVGDMIPVTMEGLEEEGFEVAPGYRFVTWDTVAEPSVTEAQLSVLESKQLVTPEEIRRQKEIELIKAISEHFHK